MHPRVYKSLLPPVPVIDKSVFTYVFEQASAFPPSHTAFIDASGGATITREQLKDLSLRLGFGLRNKVLLPAESNSTSLNGLARGDTVMFLSENSLSWPIMLFGCVAAGLRITFAATSFTPRELSWQWLDSRARAVIISPINLPLVMDMFSMLGVSRGEAKQRIWIVDRLWDTKTMRQSKTQTYNHLIDLLNFGILPEEEKFDGDDANETLYICYSSGTTGRAKGVETTHRNMTTVMGMANALWRGIETDRDVLMGIIPFYSMFGLAIHLHYPLVYGKPLVIMTQGYNPTSFCITVERYKVTTVMLVPRILFDLVTHPSVDEYDLRSLTNVACGAVPLSISLARNFLERMRLRGVNLVILQGCGSTETTCTAQIVAPIDAVSKLGSVGQLLPNLEARLVVDDDTHGLVDAEDGQPGEMWLRGPSIAKGYLNNISATQSSYLPDGWYKTGDILKRDADGYYYIVDRKKDMLKYKGYQVAPAELEAILIEHSEVADVGVVGIKDDYSGDELPRAYVVPSNSDILKSLSEKYTFGTRIQSWMESVVAVDSIPKSGSGKIFRNILRERVQIETSRKHKFGTPKL